MQKIKLFIIVSFLFHCFSSTYAIAPAGITDSGEISHTSSILKFGSVPESLFKLGPYVDNLINIDPSFETALNLGLLLFTDGKILESVFVIFRLLNKECSIEQLLDLMTKYKETLSASNNLPTEIFRVNQSLELTKLFPTTLRQEIRTAYLYHPNETEQIALRCINLSLIPVAVVIADELAYDNFDLCENIIIQLAQSQNHLANKAAKKKAIGFLSRMIISLDRANQALENVAFALTEGSHSHRQAKELALWAMNNNRVSLSLNIAKKLIDNNMVVIPKAAVDIGIELANNGHHSDAEIIKLKIDRAYRFEPNTATKISIEELSILLCPVSL